MTSSFGAAAGRRRVGTRAARVATQPSRPHRPATRRPSAPSGSSGATRPPRDLCSGARPRAAGDRRRADARSELPPRVVLLSPRPRGAAGNGDAPRRARRRRPRAVRSLAGCLLLSAIRVSTTSFATSSARRFAQRCQTRRVVDEAEQLQQEIKKLQKQQQQLGFGPTGPVSPLEILRQISERAPTEPSHERRRAGDRCRRRPLAGQDLVVRGRGDDPEEDRRITALRRGAGQGAAHDCGRQGRVPDEFARWGKDPRDEVALARQPPARLRAAGTPGASVRRNRRRGFRELPRLPDRLQGPSGEERAANSNRRQAASVGAGGVVPRGVFLELKRQTDALTSKERWGERALLHARRYRHEEGQPRQGRVDGAVFPEDDRGSIRRRSRQRPARRNHAAADGRAAPRTRAVAGRPSRVALADEEAGRRSLQFDVTFAVSRVSIKTAS